MHCYKHREAAAVAVCKVCFKAVCPACAVERAAAIACSEACAQEAVLLHEMNQRAKKIYGLSGEKTRFTSGVIMWGLFCIFFLGIGILTSVSNGRPEPFMLGFGTICGIITFIVHRRAKNIGLQC